MNRTIYKIIESIFVVSFWLFMILWLFTLGWAWWLWIFYIFTSLGMWTFTWADYYIGMIVFYSWLSALVTYPIVTRYEEQYK